jgi:hypothetical protein
MFHLDGSETSWLVYADWLDDNDKISAHIREPMFVIPSNTNWHSYEMVFNIVGSNWTKIGSEFVGKVGAEWNNEVGSSNMRINRIGSGQGDQVGG